MIASGNHYLIGVKRNQKILYKYIESILDEKSVGRSSEMEINKGRFEKREVSVFNAGDEMIKEWPTCKQIISMERTVKKHGKIGKQTAFYISSFEGSALLYSYGIRSHWRIENSLHWVKDVILREDASKIRAGEAASIFSTLRNGALNIFRENGMYQIKKAIRLTT